MPEADRIPVLVFAWNRPLYLWACLDSLYRFTRHPARFIMIDNGSTDPMVRPVIEGFVRREMFDEVEWGRDNSITRLFDAIRRYRPSFGEYFVYVEGDTTVVETSPCWLERMRALMDRDPGLMLLGSRVDQRDFIDPAFARRRHPTIDEGQLAGLIKSNSPERQSILTEDPVVDPYNPPGRLLMFRTSILDRIRLSTDSTLYKQVKALGFKAGIATGVVHRHLSLLNLFDYPDYSIENRNQYMDGVKKVETGQKREVAGDRPSRLEDSIPPQVLAKAKQRSVWALFHVKDVFVSIPDVAEAFDRYARVMGAGHDAPPRAKRVISMRAAPAEVLAALFEIAPAGESFSIDPARVIGTGNHRILQSTARSIYLACFRDARVRSTSALLEYDDRVFLDFEGEELSRLDDQLHLDPAVFRATNESAWVIPAQEPPIELREAFNLVGAHTKAFGHWMWEYLPKYVEATMSGHLPCVPVLIDDGMPASHRRALEMLLPPGVELIVLPTGASAVVAQLWCAPSPMHMPLFEKMNERFQWDFLASPPKRFKRLIGEMNRRADLQIGASEQPCRKVFFARKPALHRKMVNRDEIENIARAHGFEIVHPEDLSFDDQVRLVRNARYIVGPEGSAMFLAFFARSGTDICILNHPYTVGLAVLTGLLEEVGMRLVVVAGAYVKENEKLPHFADYEIAPHSFAAFLAEWVTDDGRSAER